jgi:DUF971 family protein
MDATPTAVNLDVGANLLTITWGDGHVSRYGGFYLRHLCPCAACRGHAPGEKPPPAWQEVKDVRVLGARAVGAYALQFDFSDGHATGIYAWTWLRDQCPSERADVDDVGRPTGAA